MSDAQGPDDSWPRKNVPASRRDDQTQPGGVVPYSGSQSPAPGHGKPGSAWSPADWEKDKDSRPTAHIEVIRTDPLLPVPSPPKPGTVAVGRRTLTGLVIVLLVAIGAVAALMLRGSSTKTIVKPANNGLVPTTTIPVATATAATTTTTTTVVAPVDTGSSASSTDASTASPASTDSQSPTDTGSTGPLPGGSPSYLGEPIDVGDSWDKDVQISGKDYSNSSVFFCDTVSGDGQPLPNWKSAGYSTFTGTIGIPDDAQDSTGSIITVTFYDQNRNSLGQAVVSIGHPQTVTINLKGAIRMQVHCVSKNNPTFNEPELALGNGALNQ